MLKIKSMSSDKGEDQVRWNSWCISKMKKTRWDFLPFHKDSWCFNALNRYTCGHLLILMLYMFIIFVVYFFLYCLIIVRVLSPSYYKQLYQNKHVPYLISSLCDVAAAPFPFFHHKVVNTSVIAYMSLTSWCRKRYLAD